MAEAKVKKEKAVKEVKKQIKELDLGTVGWTINDIRKSIFAVMEKVNEIIRKG